MSSFTLATVNEATKNGGTIRFVFLSRLVGMLCTPGQSLSVGFSVSPPLYGECLPSTSNYIPPGSFFYLLGVLTKTAFTTQPETYKML